MSTHTGGTAQEVGGPFDKEGSIGKQFTTEGAIGACDVWGVRWRTAAACVRPHLPERHSAAHVANQAALRVRSHVAAASHSRRPVPCASPHLCLAGALQRNRQAGAAAHRPGRGVPVALLLSLRSMRPVSAALPVAWSPCQCTARAAAPSLAAHAAALCALPLSPHAAASGSQAALCRRQPRRLMPRGRTCRRPRSRSRAKRCVFLGGWGGGAPPPPSTGAVSSDSSRRQTTPRYPCICCMLPGERAPRNPTRCRDTTHTQAMKEATPGMSRDKM
jgi:hypothetical protein